MFILLVCWKRTLFSKGSFLFMGFSGTDIMATKPNIVVVDEGNRKAVMVDLAIHSDGNVSK